MNLVLVEAPTTYAISVSELKTHLRVTGSAEDTLLGTYIAAASDLAQEETGRALAEQTMRLSLDTFPDVIKLPYPPVLTIEEFTYIDVDGIEQELAAVDYQLDADAEPATLRPAYGTSWPSIRSVPSAVKIEFTCGHEGTTWVIPASVKQALLMLCGHWYENREAVVSGTITKEVDLAWRSLLEPHRVWESFDQ